MGEVPLYFTPHHGSSPHRPSLSKQRPPYHPTSTSSRLASTHLSSSRDTLPAVAARLTNIPGQWLQCQANSSNVFQVLRATLAHPSRTLSWSWSHLSIEGLVTCCLSPPSPPDCELPLSRRARNLLSLVSLSPGAGVCDQRETSITTKAAAMNAHPPMLCLSRTKGTAPYRGTSLIRKRTHPPYRRTMPRVLGRS